MMKTAPAAAAVVKALRAGKTSHKKQKNER